MSSLTLSRRFALVTIALGMISLAVAQTRKPELETVSGKVTGIERKGKVAQLTVEGEGGETLEVIVPGRLQFAVVAPGDKAFFRPGTWVSCENAVLNETNKLFFMKDFTVHIGPAPQARAARNMSNGWDLTGQVIALDEESVTLKPNMKIMFDEGQCNVTVRANDAGLIEEGATIKVEGTKRGEKFLPQRVEVTLTEALSVEDFDPKNKSRRPTKTTKGSKSDSDDKADASRASDPFGIKSGAKLTEKPAAAPKVTDPFGKKPEAAPAPKVNDPFKDKPKDK